MKSTISMNRRVSRPRLTKRKKPFKIRPTEFNKRLLTFVAVLRTLPRNQLYVSAILLQLNAWEFGTENRTLLKKALPELRRMIRLNEFEDWTIERKI